MWSTLAAIFSHWLKKNAVMNFRCEEKHFSDKCAADQKHSNEINQFINFISFLLSISDLREKVCK